MIPITSITLNSDSSWTFNWISTGASFYRVVLMGKQQAQTTTTSYTWNQQGFPKFPPPLEIVSGDSPVLSEQFVPFLVIQWYGEPAASQYLIQQSPDQVTWNTIATMLEVGQWIYTYNTTILMDGTTYYYQVIAVDSVGNQSPPRSYTRYVVCPPITPDGTFLVGYNGVAITVTAV